MQKPENKTKKHQPQNISIVRKGKFPMVSEDPAIIFFPKGF